MIFVYISNSALERHGRIRVECRERRGEDCRLSQVMSVHHCMWTGRLATDSRPETRGEDAVVACSLESHVRDEDVRFVRRKILSHGPHTPSDASHAPYNSATVINKARHVSFKSPEATPPVPQPTTPQPDRSVRTGHMWTFPGLTHERGTCHNQSYARSEWLIQILALRHGTAVTCTMLRRMLQGERPTVCAHSCHPKSSASECLTARNRTSPYAARLHPRPGSLASSRASHAPTLLA